MKPVTFPFKTLADEAAFYRMGVCLPADDQDLWVDIQNRRHAGTGAVIEADRDTMDRLIDEIMDGMRREKQKESES